jgi:hypothetical protein
MHDHVQADHEGCEKFLYNQVGGFWAPVLCHYNQRRCWPVVADMLEDDPEQAELRVIPADSDRATQVWKVCGQMLTERVLGDMRLMPDSPLEGLLQILREQASAGPSRQTSALVSEMEFEPSIMSDEGFEDKSTRDLEERPEGAEASEDEIDLETDTEHELQGAEDQGATDEAEGEEADEVEQTFEPYQGVDEKIRKRMNQLAAILKRRRSTENPSAERRKQARQRRSGRDAELEKADDDKKLEELAALLKTFEENEVLPDDFAEVSLKSPVLLILAQHRSFRICRTKFFCLEENYRE